MNPKGFYFDTMLVCDYVVPPERDFLRAFNGILRYATPQIMAQTWIDSQWFSGWEQERREFNRALRVLPPGPYATLSGSGLDRNLVARAVDREGVTYFYLLNPSAWPVDVTLIVKPGVSLTDLALGTAVPVAQGTAHLALKPYEMTSLSLTGGLPSLVSHGWMSPPAVPRRCAAWPKRSSRSTDWPPNFRATGWRSACIT